MHSFIGIFLTTIISLLSVSMYSQTNNNYNIIADIENNIARGELKKALVICNSDINNSRIRRKTLDAMNKHRQLIHRIYLDFNTTQETLEALLKKNGIASTPALIAEWEAKAWLEYKIIDGQKRYFNRAVTNLQLRLQQQNAEQRKQFLARDTFAISKANYAQHLLENHMPGAPIAPQDFKITYTITVKPNTVPEGEMLSCWMPYPRQDTEMQTDIQLLDHFPKKRRISPASNAHQTIAFQQVAKKNKPTVFKTVFKFSSYARYFDLDKVQITPYDKTTKLYQKYTAEQLPHIHFDEPIQTITHQVVGDAKYPLEIVKRIYNYICQNTIWSGAQEYSIIDNIPQYVLNNQKGDCGMQTFLFMSMARYKGIPVRWLSGWMLHPGKVNLHDWCEVYYENVGWVPLDMSFQLLPSNNKSIEQFYFSGIDAYRLLVNNDISGTFFPAKRHLRSEPFDFQRGEVEWKGGNLYFDQWSYKMEVEYGDSEI